MEIENRNTHETQMFVGTEVEHTPFKGLKTFFFATTEPIPFANVIEKIQATGGIEHVYLAANHSFRLFFNDYWRAAATQLLDLGYKVTLEVPYAHVYPELHSLPHENFTLVIGLAIPNVAKFAPNTVLKIDDNIPVLTNKGVWSHMLSDLLRDDVLTTWDAYTKDEEV